MPWCTSSARQGRHDRREFAYRQGSWAQPHMCLAISPTQTEHGHQNTCGRVCPGQCYTRARAIEFCDVAARHESRERKYRDGPAWARGDADSTHASKRLMLTSRFSCHSSSAKPAKRKKRAPPAAQRVTRMQPHQTPLPRIFQPTPTMSSKVVRTPNQAELQAFQAS